MSAELLQKYLAQSTLLAKRLDSDPGALQECLHLIECGKDAAKEFPAMVEFFKGEYAFYSGQHEIALKHYLEAKGIEQLPFYCYRTSSHIYKKQGELEKALSYVTKALAIFPEDPSALSLKNALLKFMEQSKMHVPSLPAAEKERVEAGAPQVRNCSAQPDSSPKKEGRHALETSIQQLHAWQTKQIYHYMEQYKSSPPPPDHGLYVLHGWEEPATFSVAGANSPSLAMLTEDSRKASGGFYLRWNGKGIVVNPGKQFLKYFHANLGLSIYDIHFIIATHEERESYSDIQDIYDLTYQLNRTSENIHVIHYYLNLKAYQELSACLKPHFKPERHSVHCLELFLDSSDIEKIELCPGVHLHYFPTGVPAVLPAGLSREKTASLSTALGIRLELSRSADKPDESSHLQLGFVSGVSWSPMLGHHLSGCDLLIAGMGNTTSMDYEKVSYLDRELGYFGLFSLLEEIRPKLFICSEFGGREGDIRLEVVRKLRDDLYPNFSKNCLDNRNENSNPQGSDSSAVIPADVGLYIDLKTMRIRCSETGALVDPSRIKVVRSKGRFSRLLYLADECCLG
jgi:tetratricopeptide (TPR) repeat protein